MLSQVWSSDNSTISRQNALIDKSILKMYGVTHKWVANMTTNRDLMLLKGFLEISSYFGYNFPTTAGFLNY